VKGTGQVKEAEGMKKQAGTRIRKGAGPATTSDSDRRKEMEIVREASTETETGGCWFIFGCRKILLISKSASLRQLAIFELIWASHGLLLLQLFFKDSWSEQVP